MDNHIDMRLVEIWDQGIYGRKNGYYNRSLFTGLGDREPAVPRKRTISAVSILTAYARRAPDIDHMILGCFTLGLATRKADEALLSV